VSSIDSLQALGWDDAWQVALAAAVAGTPVRIVAEHRGAYHAAGAGGVAWCELPGHTYHAAADKRGLPVVGDWAVVEGWERALAGAGSAVIREVLPRRSLLVRRAAGDAVAPQPLAANVDVGIVVTSANGELSPARLDRYLAVLRDAGVPARIVVSKVDLLDDRAGAIHGLLAPLRRLAPTTALSLSGTPHGLDDVRALVAPGRTGVLLGSSGVGKSTLLNALRQVDGLVDGPQLTLPVDADDRGRHATTRRELFAAQDGALWIDTPGMRELGRFVDDDDDDDDAFDDIAELAQQCRFADCGHAGEPGCAVAGVVAPERLASYRKLVEERAIGAKDQHAARRIAETRRAKAKRYAPRPGKPGDE
jgi:ribosome biogenesis GTPase